MTALGLDAAMVDIDPKKANIGRHKHQLSDADRECLEAGLSRELAEGGYC